MENEIASEKPNDVPQANALPAPLDIKIVYLVCLRHLSLTPHKRHNANKKSGSESRTK
jgi:hypothetical protein